MKRNSLLLALTGTFGLALIAGASSALATCTSPFVGAAIQGNYAIKIVGADVDTGSGTDPTPNPIVGIGVIAVDGACDVTGGELIYNDGGTITGPTTDPGLRSAIVGFSGSLSANISANTYILNTNNTGSLTLVDTAGGMNGGNPVTFGITVTVNGAEFRGVRTNGGMAAGPPPTDDAPLSIVGERQGSATPGTPAITPATFQNSYSVLCDTTGTTGKLGLGYQPVSGTSVQHPFPIGDGRVVINGNFWFNNNGGTVNGSPLVSPSGGAFFCDSAGIVLSQSLVDGTQNTDALYENNFGCPLYGFGDETSSVLWGSSNQNAFTVVTGTAANAGFTPFKGVSSCTSAKTVNGGAVHVAPGAVTVHASGAPVTLTITNDSQGPLDYSSITLSPALSGFVNITSATCNTGANSAGSIPSDTLANGPGICTITLENSALINNPVTPCTATGSSHIAGSATPGMGLGTLTIGLNDDVIDGGTQDASGDEIAVTCTR
ncbi:MAG: hypothetical protein WBE78_09975 [Candidatus Binataceae bacterium]